MDLQGNVERFELADIFQLLSSAKKTGTLGVQRGEGIVLVYFQAGEIIYAFSPNKKIKLGDLLVKERKITSLQLEKVMNIQKELKSKKRLGELLVLESLITKKDLERVVKKQVEEVIYELLGWSKGNFKFYENQFPTEEEITIKISTENLILESVRRIDEFSRIKGKLPPFDTVLGLSSTDDDRTKDIALEASEWNILTLVDGHRDINNVLEESPLEKLETLKRIAGLLMAGLIEPVKKPLEMVKTEKLENMIDKLTKAMEKYLEK
jgi:hypothetical protein